MLIGKCPHCGNQYAGWSLKFPRNQMCECGAALVITDGDTVFHGYSPFEAEKYSINDEADVKIEEPDIKNSTKSEST